MKKIFKYKKGLFLLAIFTLLISCNENNDPDLIFEDVPSVRLEKKEKEIRDFLKASEHGWKILYFTDDSALGGFTFLFNFTNDEEVIMDSDFGNPDPTVTSLYDISVGSTIKLTFTTKNVIHELSDGANIPSSEFAGQGYRGSFEFLFSSIEGENIIFRSNRDPSNFITFEKATEESWTELRSHDTVINNINNDPTKSVFRTLKINEKLYNFSYNDATRFANNSDDETEINFGIGFTETGIIISPSIDIDGTLINEFEYDENTDKFIAKINDVEVASIFYSDLPSTPLLGYEILPDFLILHEPFLNSLAGNWNPDLTNNFREFLSNLNASISFMDVTRIDYYDLNTDSPTLFIGSSIGNAFYNLSKEIKDDKLFLTLESTTVPAFFTDAIAPLLDILLDSDGLYVDQPTTLDAFTNRIFSFIPASNTKIRFSAVQL